MIRIENAEVIGWEHVIRGMRNPRNSWEKSDSGICKGGDDGIGCENCSDCGCDHAYDHSFRLGKEDHKLMMKLAAGGSVHAKYRRMIVVYVDIVAPLYWWKEFDTYKVGTVANSCSTMHKIQAKEFTLDDFSHEHLIDDEIDENTEMYNPSDLWFKSALVMTIHRMNVARSSFLETGDKKYWWQLIQLLPSSYNQRRTVMLNYEVLAGIYPYRRNHKLDEWHDFCHWIEKLPYSEIITCGSKGE